MSYAKSNQIRMIRDNSRMQVKNIQYNKIYININTNLLQIRNITSDYMIVYEK